MITASLEKLLKKDVAFEWNQECQGSFDTMNSKMSSVPILIFSKWNKEFDTHVDASSLVLGVVLAQQVKGDLDHLITFASTKLSFSERNYTTTEREGLAMVYVLQNFRHYLMGAHFKMFTYHSALRYLVNKPVLGGNIY